MKVLSIAMRLKLRKFFLMVFRIILGYYLLILNVLICSTVSQFYNGIYVMGERGIDIISSGYFDDYQHFLNPGVLVLWIMSSPSLVLASFASVILYIGLSMNKKGEVYLNNWVTKFLSVLFILLSIYFLIIMVQLFFGINFANFDLLTLPFDQYKHRGLIGFYVLGNIVYMLFFVPLWHVFFKKLFFVEPVANEKKILD